MEHKGIKYSHIIDPNTGYGVTSLRNVTVIAKDGATADWLATACSILPISKAKKVFDETHNLFAEYNYRESKFESILNKDPSFQKTQNGY